MTQDDTIIICSVRTHLTPIQTEALEKPPTSSGQVLHYNTLNVYLELKEVHLLPVGPIQGEDIPGL